MHIPYCSYAVGSTHTFAYRTISFTSIDIYIETHTYTQPNKQIQQIQSVHDTSISSSQQMVSNDNDLTAAFRAKAIFMKSWNPASAPSVRDPTVENPWSVGCFVTIAVEFRSCSPFLSWSEGERLLIFCPFPSCRTVIAWNCMHFISRPSVGMLPPPFPRRHRPRIEPSIKPGRPR